MKDFQDIIHLLECFALWALYFTFIGVGVYFLLVYLGVL